MSTLAEIEAVIPALSFKDLAALERAVRIMRKRKAVAQNPSALDLPPLDLGTVLRPLTRDDDLLEEMLDANAG